MGMPARKRPCYGALWRRSARGDEFCGSVAEGTGPGSNVLWVAAGRSLHHSRHRRAPLSCFSGAGLLLVCARIQPIGS